MLDRLALPGPRAIEVSRNLWPNRLEGSQDTTGYLEWHRKVCPGGSLHQGNGPDQHDDLHVRGKSVEDISRALIMEMDRFHCMRAGLDAVSGLGPRQSEGAECNTFESLGPFFNLVR